MYMVVLLVQEGKVCVCDLPDNSLALISYLVSACQMTLKQLQIIIPLKQDLSSNVTVRNA